MVAAGVSIREVKAVGSSLEEVFAVLTTDTRDVEAADAEDEAEEEEEDDAEEDAA